MKVDGKEIRPIWLDKDSKSVKVIDQRWLPHKLVIADLKTPNDIVIAIKEMYVRGAPLIGITGAFGVYLSLINEHDKSDETFKKNCEKIKQSRPTAVNLAWGVDHVVNEVMKEFDLSKRIDVALEVASTLSEMEAENCRKIGIHGLGIIDQLCKAKKDKIVNILTHCNAGWLACIEYGTATAPIYAAIDKGLNIHVWVDETRPLNQGARLTAWELSKYGVPNTVITDNAGGHLMQHNEVDIVIVGADRVSCTGDTANKIGTYLKALAAKDNNIPFYVALPSSTFDWKIKDGIKEIPIEQRDPNEIHYVEGSDNGTIRKVLITPKNNRASNFAFDVTPSRLITGFITERGICKANESDISRLFPQRNVNNA